MRITVVRSLVGETIELPNGTKIRPWTFVELKDEDLDGNMVQRLKQLAATKHVQLAQVINGSPMNSTALPEAPTPTVTLDESTVKKALAEGENVS